MTVPQPAGRPLVPGVHPGLRWALALVGVIMLVVFGAAGFGWWQVHHPSGYLGFGLAFCFAAVLL